MNLVRLMPQGKILFVGDTHGDLEASIKIFEKYPDPKIRKCFLGDYVDRGPDSKGNIEFLLKKRKENPKEVYLLRGNHETFSVVKFHPADFWHYLDEEDYTRYSKIFEKLSLVV